MKTNFVVGKPKILNKSLFLKRANDILDSSIFSNGGQYQKELEAFICNYLGVKHAVVVCNATIGLELAIKATNPNAKSCLVPSFTFVASVSTLRRLGIKPVFVDITEDYCMDFNDAVALLPTDIIMPVDLFGNHSEAELNNLAPISIVDSAHAFGCFNTETNGYVGKQGEAHVFSFHSTKLGGAFEGGVITCQDDDLAEELRELRSFGYRTSSGLREGQVVHQEGTNAKLSELNCAAILTQLENIQEIQGHYFDIHERYKARLGNLLKDKSCYFSNFSYVIVEVESHKRDKIIEQLNSDNIYPRTYFSPIHQMEVFKEFNIRPLPNTEAIAKRIMALPTGLTISLEDVDYICDRFLKAYGK